MVNTRKRYYGSLNEAVLEPIQSNNFWSSDYSLDKECATVGDIKKLYLKLQYIEILLVRLSYNGYGYGRGYRKRRYNPDLVNTREDA